LWAAIGALGAATLAMGVALVQMRSAPAPAPATPATPAAPNALGTPPRDICAHCGTATAVTPLQRGGTGKTLATVVGAVGGGYAGNTVEKRMKKETVYHVDLRMEDGSTMRLEHASPLSVDAHVTVANGVITQ
jgi:hypothetical protein